MSVISVHITQCTVASCELFVSNYILHITNKQLRLGLTVWCSQFSVDRLIRMRSQLTLASQFAHNNFQLCGKNQVSVRLINVWGEKKKKEPARKNLFFQDYISLRRTTKSMSQLTSWIISRGCLETLCAIASTWEQNPQAIHKTVT